MSTLFQGNGRIINPQIARLPPIQPLLIPVQQKPSTFIGARNETLSVGRDARQQPRSFAH
ncbi:MAG: hypothetical protein DME59_18295 [Verrucomicrobia bacterium]|nr:MAG: hypothetical protein DME59_18295 [Verrucomicrobiota bacterium]